MKLDTPRSPTAVPTSGKTPAGGPPEGPVLSVLIPVYNERYLIAELLRRVLEVEIPELRGLEVVVVDDGSTDGTRDILEDFRSRHPNLEVILHERNQGKGAAVRTGIAAASGDLIVIQDADLEYDPRDYARLVRPILEDGGDVVYGSRFLSAERRRVLYFRHTLGNRLITFVSNCFTDLNLTDIETCYKMFRAELLKSLPIRSDDFAMEAEITAKIAKRNCRIFEVPVSYLGRTYAEGKKITWRDGFKALKTILKYWIVDDIYKEDRYGSAILHRLERARRFNRWMAGEIEPWVGSSVLEIGAGIGNITSRMLPRESYVASDINPHYLAFLRNFAARKPYLRVERIDLEAAEDFVPWSEEFDTVLCLNVLEHVRDPAAALRNIASVLEPGGRLLLYVPQGQGLYSSLDEVLGHRVRYDRAMLQDELRTAGLEAEYVADFNRSGVPGWWLNGKVLRRRHFSRVQLKLFDLALPILRRVDRWLPWRGLGLIAVARKPA